MQGGKGRRCSGVLAHPLPLGHGLEGAWGGGERPPPGTPGLLGFSRVQDGPLDFMGHDRDLGLGRVRTRWWWGGRLGVLLLWGPSRARGPWETLSSRHGAGWRWRRGSAREPWFGTSRCRRSPGAAPRCRRCHVPPWPASSSQLHPPPREQALPPFPPHLSVASMGACAAVSIQVFFLIPPTHPTHPPPPPRILPASQNSPIDALSTMDGTRWLVHWRERDQAWDVVTRCLFLHQGWSKVHPPPPTRQHLPG